MHINDLDQFSIMTMYTLANNTIMPSMKENISLVVKIRAFQDFYFMPCILINMHDIDTKNNRDHLRAMGYLGTTMHNNIQHFDIIEMYTLANNMFTLYAMYPTYRSWDSVYPQITYILRAWDFKLF